MSSAARPIRILYLINSLETGGAERQLALTVARLDRSRFEPVVCCLFSGGPFLDEVRRARVEVRALGLRKTLWKARTGARRAIEQVRPGLVHTAMFEANVAGRLVAHRAGIPVVSHATNRYESELRYAESTAPAWKLRGARALERWSARRSGAHVVAVGEAVARSASAFLRIPPERVTVVRRGFDFAELDAAAHGDVERPAWPDGASPRLLSVGRLAPQKGHRYLIEAMPAIQERHPKAHLAIAGTGPLDARLRSLAETVGAEVTFLGVRRDVPALLAAADAFVLPSLWEGAAGALVEAMGLGVPAAVTDDEALREMAGDAAWTFPPKAPAALANAVGAIADDLPAARVRARAAVERVRAAHEIVANTRTLEDLYLRLLA